MISTVGFEQELAALQVETGSDGKLQLADQPFLQVSLPACFMLAAIADSNLVGLQACWPKLMSE